MTYLSSFNDKYVGNSDKYVIKNLLKPLKIRYFLFFSFISVAVEGEFLLAKRGGVAPNFCLCYDIICHLGVLGGKAPTK